MNNKKTIIASIIGVALLVLTVVGATYAYFTTVTSNDNGETTVAGKTDAIGSVALTNPTSNLHIALSALDMAQDNLNTYWATNDSTLNYDSEEVQRDIAVATLTGGETTTYYECSTTINVSVSGTMVAGLQTGDAYIQFGGLLTNKVDLKNVSTTGYPVTFALNGTDTLTQSVSAAIAIENRNANQNSIAGKELTVTFSNDDLVCKVVETPDIPSFAIYSETDNSLRIYKNNDTVNVGDTYKDLKVTNIFTGFENSNETPPWKDSNTFNYNLISKVIVEDEITPLNTKGWFNSFLSVETMDLTKLDMSRMTDMSSMFNGVGMNLEEGSTMLIGVENWNTSNVTNMSRMFDNANINQNSNINEWDTSNVTNMSSMFLDAWNIPDISEWSTSNVTDMSYMFWFASDFPDISGWNVSSVTNMTEMFYSASNIPDISGWDVSSVTNMSSMFSEAQNIPDISQWKVSNVTNMSGMFQSVNGIPDISQWDTSNVTKMFNMFRSAKNIPDISGWTVSSVTDMAWMFNGATTGYTAENPLDLSKWDVSNVTNSTSFISSIKPTGSIISPNFGATS